MTSYCHIQEAYNNNFDELDKMAREVNNKKKNAIKDVYKDYRNTQIDLSNGIKAFENYKIVNKNNNNNVDYKNGIGYFSAQGNMSKYKPNNYDSTIIKDIYKSPNNAPLNNAKALDIQISDESINDSIDDSDDSLKNDDSIDSSLDSPSIDKIVDVKKLKKRNKSKHNKSCVDFDLDSIDSIDSLNSGESLLSHARKCHNCKDKLMKLIKKSSANINDITCSKSDKFYNDKIYSDKIYNDKIYNNKLDNNSSEEPIDTNKNIPEMKELITICLIGLLVIVILDFMMKTFK